ncbi:unnamed protein product, partial [Rotaria magnacalcarata]
TDDTMKNTIKSNNKSDHENVSSTEINLMRNLTKRKRDISAQDIKSNTRISKSTSSISGAQPKLKKLKRRTNLNIPTTTTITNNTAYKYYRQPIYLKRSPMILIQMLTNIINYNFKKKEEQICLYHRLDLLDKHYYLQVHQQLWQSYSDIGIQQHRWPDQLYTMAKTNDFQICQKYLDNHIIIIKKEIETCHIQLNNQAQSYPVTTLSLDQLDHYLREFVDCERKYLSMRNNKQLQKFIDNYHEKQLFETISAYHISSIDQNQYINRLMSIREKQATIYEELLMLEMRVLFQLQEYDQQYENEFLQLESHLLNSININGSSIYEQIQQHMNYQTNKLKQQVSMKIRSLRGILIKNHRRSSSAKNTVGVWPEPYLELLTNVFNCYEWKYLSFGPSCIRINQSAICPRHQQEIAIRKDHKSIYDKVRSHLNEHYFVPMTATILKQYSNQLLHDLNLSYFSPLSYNDQTLA